MKWLKFLFSEVTKEIINNSVVFGLLTGDKSRVDESTKQQGKIVIRMMKVIVTKTIVQTEVVLITRVKMVFLIVKQITVVSLFYENNFIIIIYFNDINDFNFGYTN